MEHDESEGCFELRDHRFVFLRGKEFLLGIHSKRATPLKAIFVLGNDVYVAMLPRIAIRAIVHLVWLECLVDSCGDMADVAVEGIHFILGHVGDFTDVLLCGHDAAPGMALLLEKYQDAGRQFADKDTALFQQRRSKNI